MPCGSHLRAAAQPRVPTLPPRFKSQSIPVASSATAILFRGKPFFTPTVATTAATAALARDKFQMETESNDRFHLLPSALPLFLPSPLSPFPRRRPTTRPADYPFS